MTDLGHVNEGDVATLYAAWRKATDESERLDTEEADQAEQVAWDDFRDACDAVYGDTCPHAECPPAQVNWS